MSASKFLSARDVAIRYGRHPQTLKRLSKAGEFPAFVKLGGKRGSHVAWAEKDLDFHDEILLGQRRATS